MIGPKIGQRVKVELEGEVVALKGYDDCIVIEDDESFFHYVYIPEADDPGLKVTVVTP